MTSTLSSDDLGTWERSLNHLLERPGMLGVDLARPKQVGAFVTGMDATTGFAFLNGKDGQYRRWAADQLGVEVGSLIGIDQVIHARYGNRPASSLSEDDARDASKTYVKLVLRFVRSQQGTATID